MAHAKQVPPEEGGPGWWMPSSRVTQQGRSKAALAVRGDDFYETPKVAVEALLSVERFEGAIWEPACGAGAIVRVLEAAGHEVVATDLVERGVGTARVDFLMEQRLLAPNICTNPPYKLADEFARKALDLGAAKTAMLLRLVWLAGQRRRSLVASCARVWVFSARLPRMHRGDWEGPRIVSSSVDFAWFIWSKDYSEPPTLGWL